MLSGEAACGEGSYEFPLLALFLSIFLKRGLTVFCLRGRPLMLKFDDKLEDCYYQESLSIRDEGLKLLGDESPNGKLYELYSLLDASSLI